MAALQPYTHPDGQSLLSEEEHHVLGRYLVQTKIQTLKEIQCRKMEPISTGSDDFINRTSAPLGVPESLQKRPLMARLANRVLTALFAYFRLVPFCLPL